MSPINRRLLKDNAKVALKNNFWVAILVLLVGSFLGCNWNGLTGNSTSGSVGRYTNYSSNSEVTATQSMLLQLQNVINFVTDSEFDYDYDESKTDSKNIEDFYAEFLSYFDLTHENFMGMIATSIVVIMVVLTIVSIITICIQFAIGSFVSAPVGVGVRKFFMNNRKASGKFTDMFDSFGKGRYMNTVKAMFSVNIRIFGWSLLFYFPGLVKFYQYYFAAYIMAENPNITPQRAREISTQMSSGHKWQIFVLELSFIGWMLACVGLILLLSICTCGILMLPSMLLIYPLSAYQHATFAELYAERREYALVTGMVSEQELCGF